MHPIQPLIYTIYIYAYRPYRLGIGKSCLRRQLHPQFIPDKPFRTVIPRISDFQRFILVNYIPAFYRIHILK